MSQELTRAIIFDGALASFEKFILLACLAEPELLSMTGLQMSARLNITQHHLSAAMARLKRMNVFRRSLVSKSLEINEPTAWKMLSKK